MPIAILHPAPVSGTTGRLLVGITALFLVLPATIVRRVIPTILSPAPAQPRRPAARTRQSVRSAPPSPSGAVPAAPDRAALSVAPSPPPPA